jgi:hypothetical protein
MRIPACLSGAVIALAAPSLRAQEVTVRIQETPAAMQFAQQAGVSVPMLEGQIRTELQNLFQTYRVADYLRSFGAAQGFASRGMGVDYGSSFDLLTLGVAGNLSLNIETAYQPSNTQTRPIAGGLGLTTTVMGGLNLAFFGLPPIAIFLNYFSQTRNADGIAAELSNFGVHVRYKLWGWKGSSLMSGLFRWGGLDLTTGIERSRLRLGLGQNFQRDIPVANNPQAAQMGFTDPVVGVTAGGLFDLDMRSLSIPLEVTTNIRLLYILSLYTGFGLDLEMGSGSSLAVDLNGDMVGRVTGPDGRRATAPLGSASVNVAALEEPSPGRLRWLLGVQVNVLILKVFAQLNLAAQDPLIASVALGARVAY